MKDKVKWSNCFGLKFLAPYATEIKCKHIMVNAIDCRIYLAVMIFFFTDNCYALFFKYNLTVILVTMKY